MDSQNVTSTTLTVSMQRGLKVDPIQPPFTRTQAVSMQRGLKVDADFVDETVEITVSMQRGLKGEVIDYILLTAQASLNAKRIERYFSVG